MAAVLPVNSSPPAVITIISPAKQKMSQKKIAKEDAIVVSLS